MFDYFLSSYELGDAFTDIPCQTKDIEYSIGGTMSHYWLDPSGRLYVMNFSGTHSFHAIEEDDPRYDANKLFTNFEWVPTGKNGKVEPHFLTKYIHVYPENWQGSYDEWPTMLLHFKMGLLIDYEDVTGKPRFN